jgi:hypothetical protein
MRERARAKGEQWLDPACVNELRDDGGVGANIYRRLTMQTTSGAKPATISVAGGKGWTVNDGPPPGGFRRKGGRAVKGPTDEAILAIKPGQHILIDRDLVKLGAIKVRISKLRKEHPKAKLDLIVWQLDDGRIVIAHAKEAADG